MPMTTSSQFVQDKFDEAFHLDHDRRDSYRDKYKSQLSHFQVHLPHQNWKGDDRFRVLEHPEQPHRLVSILVSVKLDGTPEHVQAHLDELRKSLDALIRDGEQCHLFVEDEARVVHAEGVIKYEAKGTIGPGELPPTSP